MPIPTYSVIADNEIDPESPLTTWLMFRLRDNALAVLGIDPADPAPVFTIPPSVQEAAGAGVLFASGSGATATTAEFVISEIADDVEWLELSNDGDNTTGSLVPHSFQRDSTPTMIDGYMFDGYNIHSIDVVYSLGVPTGVRFRVGQTRVIGTSTRATTDTTVTLTNTYQGIGGILSAKCRATASQVFLTLRVAAGGAFTTVCVPFTRRSFKSKAAV